MITLTEEDVFGFLFEGKAILRQEKENRKMLARKKKYQTLRDAVKAFNRRKQ